VQAHRNGHGVSRVFDYEIHCLLLLDAEYEMDVGLEAGHGVCGAKQANDDGCAKTKKPAVCERAFGPSFAVKSAKLGSRRHHV
jgi:hypothetical protein